MKRENHKNGQENRRRSTSHHAPDLWKEKETGKAQKSALAYRGLRKNHERQNARAPQ